MILPGSTTSKKMMSIREPPYGVCFSCYKLPLGRNLPLPQLQTACCCGQAGHGKANCQTLQGQGRQVLHNSCFTEKSVQCWARRPKMDASMSLQNPGCLSRQPAVADISIVLEAACFQILISYLLR